MKVPTIRLIHDYSPRWSESQYPEEIRREASGCRVFGNVSGVWMVEPSSTCENDRPLVSHPWIQWARVERGTESENRRNEATPASFSRGDDRPNGQVKEWESWFEKELESREIVNPFEGDSLAHVLAGRMEGRWAILDLSLLSVRPDPEGLGPLLAGKNALILDSPGEDLWVVSSGVLEPLQLDRIARRTGRRVHLALAPTEQVREARSGIEMHTGRVNEDRTTGGTPAAITLSVRREEGSTSKRGSADAPAEQRLRYLLARSLVVGASDIHIEPDALRIRRDGVLSSLFSHGIEQQRALASMVKGLAGMDQANQYNRQDGSFSLQMDTQIWNVRVSALPVSNHRSETATQKIVMRLLPQQSRDAPSLEKLGFSDHQLSTLRRAVQRPQGLVLITGPTGSGKTTTIYGLLRELAGGESNILTFEDPIEYELEGVSQTQLDPMRGLDGGEIRRGYVRQDPDLIFLGEIRDHETAMLALEASLTGHLVISTLHTESAGGAVHRLASLGAPLEMLSQSLLLLQAQRLVRRLCPVCREPVPFGGTGESEKWERHMVRAGLEIPRVTWRARGCTRCQGSGYQGRVVLMELVPVTRTVSHALLRAGCGEWVDLPQAVIGGPGSTLYDDALRRVIGGEITLEQASLYGHAWEE